MPTKSQFSTPAHTGSHSIEDLAIRSGITAEHVVLSGDDLASPEKPRSATVRQRLHLRDRATGRETFIRIFQDGYLSFYTGHRGKYGTERTIDLRFVNPHPRLSRSVARRARRLTLSCLAAGVVTGAGAWFSVIPLVSGALTIVLTAGCAVAAMYYVRGSRERSEFRTLHGGAVVLTLTASLGSLRSQRRAVPGLVAEIRRAQRMDNGDRQLSLREEMREHYRLASTGTITDEACGVATRRILERF